MVSGIRTPVLMLPGQVLYPLNIAHLQCMQYMCFSSSTSNGVAKFDSFPPKEGRGEPAQPMENG